MNAPLAFVAIAAGVLLAATQETRALPPKAHLETGLVTAVDCASRSIWIQSKPQASAKRYVWFDGTRFSYRGSCPLGGIKQEQSVRVYYRRENGKNVLREVNSNSAALECQAGRR